MFFGKQVTGGSRGNEWGRFSLFTAAGLVRRIRGGFRHSVIFDERFNAFESPSTPGGYSSTALLLQVAETRRKYLDGLIEFERDGIALDQESVPWEAVSALAVFAAACKHPPLRVLDLGGSFATMAHIIRSKFGLLVPIEFLVVEQTTICELAEERQLGVDVASFTDSMDSALESFKPEIIFSSSAVQYVMDDNSFFRAISSPGVRGFVLDRVPVHDHGPVDVMTLQRTLIPGHHAEYGHRIFSEERLKARLSDNFSLLYEFDSVDGVRRTKQGLVFWSKGYVGSSKLPKIRRR